MLDLKEGTPLYMLRQFTVHFDARLKEELGAAHFSINNQKGKGFISLYDVFPGLTAWIYNIKFFEDFVFNMEFSEERPCYFGYHHTGYQLQKYPNENQYNRIEQRQNFILCGETGTYSEFKVPAGIDFKSCYLILNPSLIDSENNKERRFLETNLHEIFKDIGDQRPYRYFGDINTKIAIYTDIIINNKRTDIVGRLLVEGAIYNMLAAQIDAHDSDINTLDIKPKVSNSELSRITELGEYIKNNIGEKLSISHLSKKIPITPKKLQAGIRFLYGCSVNQYISKMRLELAKELLLNSDLSVSEICYNIGYTSRSHFSKKFLEHFDYSPSDYREIYVNKNLVYEISYRSKAKEDISVEVIDEIIDVARTMNDKYNVTGSLIYHHRMFFQIIEGQKNNILQLYENIKKDKRHQDVTLMWKGFKANRDFANWNMAVLAKNGIIKSPTQAGITSINLKHLLGKVDDKTLASKNLWDKVRNVIKLSS